MPLVLDQVGECMMNSIPPFAARHPHRPHSVGSHDSSVSSSTSSHTFQPPSVGMYTAGHHAPPPPVRNQAQAPSAQLPAIHSVTRSPAAPPSSIYGNHYGNPSTSPSVASSVFHSETVVENGYPSSGMSPPHLSGGLSAQAQAQKRAYRQRRKDPSCDACRERKVKCDATDTQSCSECATRSVKCQFTKDTNRRMSSIKNRQVQDLQNQLYEARQELAQKERALSDMREPEAPKLKLPEIRPSTERRVELPVLPDFENVRQNIRNYGKGVFKMPPLYRQQVPPAVMTGADQPLPPKALVDKLLSQYYFSIHRLYPMLHWQTFTKEVEDLYEKGTFEGAHQVWISKFYVSLACGTLQTLANSTGELMARPAAEGVDFMRAATRTVNTWTDEMSMHHAQSCLLISIFLFEMNLKSAGWVWLGSAVRIAQEIGLQIETGPWGTLEDEMRKRLWWCIYAQDRLLSIEGGRPVLINDEDCQVGWPCPVDDQFVQPNMILKQPSDIQSHSSLGTVIPVVRFISQLKTTLKARVIAPQTIATYDSYFTAVESTFPEHFQSQSTTYLEPHHLTVAFFLQTARFHLYRHNLSVLCSPAERVEAINRCLAAAKDTARYISRSLQTPPSTPTYPTSSEADLNISRTEQWQSSVKSTALNISCMHLWRCILVLSFRADFNSALSCIRVSSAIGILRNLNIACGRHIAFFLEALLTRWRSGRGSAASLEQDEEMLAYLSGDLQGSTENSWVWTGSETGSKLNANGDALTPAVTLDRPLTAAAALGPKLNGEHPVERPNDPANHLLPKEKPSWGGWDKVEQLIHELMEEQQRVAAYVQESRAPYSYHRPAHNEGKRQQLAPPDPPASVSPGRPPPPPLQQQPPREQSAGASRISIANII